MNSIKDKLAKEVKNFKRTALLRGSPAFRISVWFSGITVGLAWILISEYNNPKSNNIFIKKKKADFFTTEEIEKWNKPYYSKGEDSTVVMDSNMTADEKRKKILKGINNAK
ncbi:Uncharacterized protein PCOAH_00002490 [Plasmodium coatneyi]|uniref:Uncharacterized protein n=1 Tax=Plasmodium coatneyi TaxID=208452 RepID=A0A1B1DTG8_9APIC|nr:Uncharacterized protein PCOAH_00002490 [Plasmodium coatneyi]ANQ06081.1 Uncharacterized protein PCOAH_00002490 [Plasmodium coatneyi]